MEIGIHSKFSLTLANRYQSQRSLFYAFNFAPKRKNGSFLSFNAREISLSWICSQLFFAQPASMQTELHQVILSRYSCHTQHSTLKYAYKVRKSAIKTTYDQIYHSHETNFICRRTHSVCTVFNSKWYLIRIRWVVDIKTSFEWFPFLNNICANRTGIQWRRFENNNHYFNKCSMWWWCNQQPAPSNS